MRRKEWGIAFWLVSIIVMVTAAAVRSEADSASRVVRLEPALFDGIETVVVSQNPDAVYKKPVDYEAYPFSAVLIKAFPDWKTLIASDAMLVLRATHGYAPVIPFSEAFSGRAYITRKIVGYSDARPYDCWQEGGEEHCDLDYFLIWTDGIYPQRVQPWGTRELALVPYRVFYADAIPKTDSNNIKTGFSLYQKYCIECHRINFVGGEKATEHIVRAAPLTKPLLDYFLYSYKKDNPNSYMQDFTGVLDSAEARLVFEYLDYMAKHQNICRNRPSDKRC